MDFLDVFVSRKIERVVVVVVVVVHVVLSRSFFVFCLAFFSDFLIFLISFLDPPQRRCGMWILLFIFFSKRKRRPKHTQKR